MIPGANAELISAIRADLRAAADPDRAPQMQAYMKSSMAYLGVPVPIVRKIARAAAASHRIADLDQLINTATELWRSATHREERYAATELTGLRIAVGKVELLPLCREMIVSGAWWDHVDAVSHQIGAMLRADPVRLLPVVRSWSVDPDLWLRRSSIICQLGFKDRTDPELLSEVIIPNLAGPGVLHPQGHRLGTTGVRPHRSGLGSGLCIRTRRGDQPALPSRGPQAPGLRTTRRRQLRWQRRD